MNAPVNGADEPKKPGYFKMQIGSRLGLFILGQDASVEADRIPDLVDHIVERGNRLKPEGERSPLPLSPTVSSLADWFCQNQLARAAPKTSP